MYALSRLVYANIKGEILKVDSMTAILERGCKSQILGCSTRPAMCPQAEIHFFHVLGPLAVASQTQA